MMSMIDETYVNAHQEDNAKRYIDFLLQRVNSLISNYQRVDLIDEYVFKKSMIVDISFACELLLKILLLREGHGYDTIRDHNLELNYNNLSWNVRNSIKTAMINMGEVDFDNKLHMDINRFTYEKSRYVYEADSGNTDYVFLSNLCRVLYKEVNGVEIDYQLVDSNMSQTDYDSIDKETKKDELIKRYTDYLSKKIDYSKELFGSDEVDNYLLRNISSCDMALFCELLLKKYSESDVKGHEYKDLYKKLEDAVRFMFEKGIYSDFETNKDDRYTLYYSEESFLYPDNFTKIHSVERSNILKKLSDIFLLSRYGCFEFFDKYNEIFKFYKITKAIDVFVDGNEAKIKQLYEFREIVNYGSWYGFNVDEILSIDMDYLKKINDIYKNYLMSNSILYYRNLIFISKENQSKVIDILKNKFDDYYKILEVINDDTIDYFFGDTRYVDALVKISNNVINFNDVIKLGLPYVYSLISDEVIGKCPGLIVNIIKTGKKYDILRIVKVLQIVLNSNNLNDVDKYAVVNNLAAILDYSDSEIAHAIAMISLSLTVRDDVTVGSINPREFLTRDMKDVKRLIDFYKKYSIKIVKDFDYFDYLSKGDPDALQLLEDYNVLERYKGVIDISIFKDKATVYKYIRYLSNHTLIDANKINILNSDLSEDEIYRFITSTNYFELAKNNLASKSGLRSYWEKEDKLKDLLSSYGEFLTFDFIRYFPDHLLANDAYGLKKLLSDNYFFVNFHTYDSLNKQFIARYFESIFRNYANGTLVNEFDRFMYLCSMSIYRDYPKMLEMVKVTDANYYTATTLNVMYEKIKNGVFECGGRIEKVDDTSNLVSMFLSCVTFDTTDIARINDLFSSVNIIRNMSYEIMRLGKKEVLDEKAKDFNNNNLIKDYNKSPNTPGTIYDIIAITYNWVFNDLDEYYDYVKDYLDYLDTIYRRNKALRGDLINHVGLLLSVYRRGLFTLKVNDALIEAKKYMIAHPDKFNDILSDMNNFLNGCESNTFAPFKDEELGTLLMFVSNRVTPPPVDVPLNYEVLDEEYEPSKLEIAEKRLEVLKSIVKNKFYEIKYRFMKALYDTGARKMYLSIKEYLIKISKANERKFMRVEKEVSKALEREVNHGRSR